ncbi:MAG: CvpA family protein [bacterium]
MIIFDLILLIILFIFVSFGWWLGLIQTLGALIGIALGAYLAGLGHAVLGGWLTPIFLGHEVAAKIVAFIILFTLINRLVGLLFWVINKVFNIISIIPFLKTINRLAGAILGLAEGVLVLGTILFVIGKYSSNDWFNGVVNTSDIAGWLMAISTIILPLLPEALKVLKSKF